MKQTAVDWVIEQLDYLNREKEENLIDVDTFFVKKRILMNQAKEMEKQQQGYSEEELVSFGKSCFYRGFDKAENDDANSYTGFREEIKKLLEQFKNK
jgi:hypothetical protein